MNGIKPPNAARNSKGAKKEMRITNALRHLFGLPMSLPALTTADSVKAQSFTSGRVAVTHSTPRLRTNHENVPGGSTPLSSNEKLC
jgi:hypothetical protein